MGDASGRTVQATIKCASEGKQCYACGGKNHFANSRDCQQKGKEKKDKTSSKIQQVEGDSGSEDELSRRILEKVEILGKVESEISEDIFTSIEMENRSSTPRSE